MSLLTQPDLVDLAKTVSAKFKTRASAADKAGALPKEDIADLAMSGLMALTVPKSHGGFEASLADTVAVQLELAKGSGSTALVAAMTFHGVAHENEVNGWKSDLRDELFERVAKGDLLNNVASEPRLGSPSRGGLPDTFAELNGDTYVLQGHKNWVTGGEHLSHLLVRLRLKDDAVVMWVPKDTEGLRWQRTWGDSLSLRASDSHDLYLENATIPARNILQEGSSPANVWFAMLMAATYLGVALAARDDVIRYTLERVPTALGKPIATLPKIQRQVGELDLELESAKLFLLQTASLWRAEETERSAYQAKIAAAKHLAVEAALSATDKALRIAGGAGIDKGMHLERYFRDVRAGIMHPPSGDAALEMIGRAAIDAS